MSESKYYFKDLTWEQVVWYKTYNKVRCIQRRIYKAKISGETYRVRWLQRLLITNPHAKLVAVHQVTTLNKGKGTAGIDKVKNLNSDQKIRLARNLSINGKSSPILRKWIPKPGKEEMRPLGIPTLNDRAKQALAKLALEPEWEAVFEPNSYGFRPGRRTQDAIESIFLALSRGISKYVFDADIRKCFDKINHEALLKKLDTFPLMQQQIAAWLETGIMDQYASDNKMEIPTMGTPQGGVISPLLCNIALHGLEQHLKEFVAELDNSYYPGQVKDRRSRKQALSVIRYADDFVIIHKDKTILELCIKNTEIWLKEIGLEISQEKSCLRPSGNGFKFLGFQIVTYNKQEQTKVKITPSLESRKRLIKKTHDIIQRHKASSAYMLISKLRPTILGWGNYYKYVESSKAFSSADNLIFHQIRAWVMRRAVKQSRSVVTRKYFPKGRTYKFQGREYEANWILNGLQANGSEKPKTNHLPKLQWIKIERFIKIRDVISIFGPDHVYWAIRTSRYSSLSTRVQNLLRSQKGKCKLCRKSFTYLDVMEVDHIIPLAKRGTDTYLNLQLLHRQCHIQKTKLDFAQ